MRFYGAQSKGNSLANGAVNKIIMKPSYIFPAQLDNKYLRTMHIDLWQNKCSS